MKLTTTRFGTIDVEEDRLIFFPQGLPGFEQLTRWCLLHQDDAPGLNWLQSWEDPDVAILLADPDQIFQNYDVELDIDNLAPLNLSVNDGETDTHLVVMRVVLRLDGNGVVANLRAPILFNTQNNRAMQIVLPLGTFPTAERLRPSRVETADLATSDGVAGIAQQTVV